MFVAQTSLARKVYNLTHKVRAREVIKLSHEEVINVEHDLGQEPVTFAILRRVYQITSDISTDRQRHEIPAERGYVEIRVAGCRKLSTWRQGTLVTVVGIEKASRKQ